MTFDLTQIGTVRSEFDRPTDPATMRKHESQIILDPKFADGLTGINDNDSLTILFYLHKSTGYDLVAPRRDGIDRGTFACRSPHRPSPIGSTTVGLVERDGHELRVTGLDAIDGTPVLDIKPYAASLDRPPHSGGDDRRKDPRSRIEGYVRHRAPEALLLEAGEVHGHFCPYLALGVMAGAHAIRKLGVASTGMEDVVAVVETNSCFADGVQVTTGCTFGNNGLIYRDYGKTAVTLVSRENPEEGVRLHVKERKGILEKDYPEAHELFERVVAQQNATAEERERFSEAWATVAFDLLERPVPDLFDVETAVADGLPELAPIFENTTCAACGEQVMASKAVEQDGKKLCRACAGAPFGQLDGHGLNWQDGA
ncbi:tRNA (N6-threonylcarbamoyladenosine(37)-N6)-methyltransferase TrmO [Halodesulfurarchaeum sp.]|uniref:tRNA (N6-threonylcarbamoyladenosine(37)-N6)-methyltransferase TrmO n=1 Tax=Halodesulfurarchaeum sp. TaxID=1980530 RepID=UPI002FC382C2